MLLRRTDIALLKNTSEALSMVAHGLDWQAGDNVVIGDQEFPSNRIVWQSLAPHGVETRRADLSYGCLAGGGAPCAASIERTRLLAMSSVQYASAVCDWIWSGWAARAGNAKSCSASTPSRAWARCPWMCRACGADFVMADGHKWLLAPEGCAMFYSKPGGRDRLRLHAIRLAYGGRPFGFLAHRLAGGRQRPPLRVRQPQHAGHPCPVRQASRCWPRWGWMKLRRACLRTATI